MIFSSGWMRNEGPKWLFIIIWAIVEIGLFAGTYVQYNTGLQYYYLRYMVKHGLAWARANAACLNFNCALILLPVCRNLLLLLRQPVCCTRSARRLLDKHISFHKFIAYAIFVHAVLHLGAHCFNFEQLFLAWDLTSGNTTTAEGLKSALSSLSDAGGNTYVNPVSHVGDAIFGVLSSLPGVSGVVITLCLVLMLSSSTYFIRRSFFEVFWYTHHLFILFFAGFIVHGFQGVIRAQTNTEEHDPEQCAHLYTQWGDPNLPHCPVPQFASQGAQSWKWVIGPIIIYLIECCIRLNRSLKAVQVVKVVSHPSQVLELQLRQQGFHADPGQYVFLKCPAISRLEWHPFTLTSAPLDDYFSVHIRVVGDWTTALHEAFVGKEETEWPRIAADGPYGTPTEDVFNYDAAVLVGMGIGITPVASILRHIWQEEKSKNRERKLRSVVVVWVSGDAKAFEWFAELLQQLEAQLAADGKAGFLQLHIFWTRGWDTATARQLADLHASPVDVITGLRDKTQFGRPHWDTLFSHWADTRADLKSIGVFFCGPKEVSSTLRTACHTHSSSEPEGLKFFFNKENF